MLALAYRLRKWGPDQFAIALELPSTLRLLGKDAPTSWVQIAQPGTFKGHRDGDFELTGSVFKRFISNFRKMINPIPFVIGHPDREVPAVGYLHKFKLAAGNKLYGLVEWTKRGAELIRDGGFRFCSMVFHLRFPDFASGKDQGPTITEVGLTNKPFLRGMDPITCSFEPTHRRALSMDPEKTLAAIAKALGVPEDAGPEAMAAALQAIFALKAAQKGNTVAEEEGGGEPPAGEGEEPPPADENELELSLEGEPPPPADGGGETDAPAMAAEALGAVAEVMGVDLATVIASIREAPEAVAAALAPPAEGSEGAAFSMATFGAETRRLTAEVESLTGEKQALTTQVTELEKQLKEQSEQGTRRAELDSAIELGILRESQKAIALRFIDDEKAFRDYMDDAKAHPSVPQGTKLSTPGPDETGKGADTASARQEQVDALSPVEAAQYYQFYGTQGYDHGTAVKMSQEYSKRMEGKDMKQAGDVLHALKKDFGPPQQATK